MSFSNTNILPNNTKVEYVDEYSIPNNNTTITNVTNDPNYYQESVQRYQPLPPVTDFYHSNYQTWNNVLSDNNTYSYPTRYSQLNDYSTCNPTISTFNTNNLNYGHERQTYPVYSSTPITYTTCNYVETPPVSDNKMLPVCSEPTNPDPMNIKSFQSDVVTPTYSITLPGSYASDSTGTEKSYSDGRGDTKLVKKRKTKRVDSGEKSPDEKKDYKRTANNIRERIRVHDINAAFSDLAKMCSEYIKEKEEKHTKLTILQQAVEVIKVLENEVEKKRVRHNGGLEILSNDKVVYEKEIISRDLHVRCSQYSHNGKYFAYCDSINTLIINAETKKEIVSEPLSKTQSILFSPNDNIMVTWEPYVVYGKSKPGEERKPNPNLRYWRVSDGQCLVVTVAAKDTIWQPQWTADENYAIRFLGSEILVYENNSFERYVWKKSFKKLGNFKISPGQTPIIAMYHEDKTNEPARVEIRRIDKDFSILSTRTLFKSDKVSLKWNSKGNALLCQVFIEVDKSNKNYYGEQHLYLLTLGGDNGIRVTLDKEGPIYAAQWNPNGIEFAVCYGYMPSKVSMFNLKGDITWSLPDGHRNEMYYNPFGNILVVCGFSNISSGLMEFWDTNKKTLISKIERPDTTLFSWAPDGQHFLTATCAPRLRTNNGYIITHYTGKNIISRNFESPKEIWEVILRPSPMNKHKEFAIEKGSTQLSNKKKEEHPLDKLVNSGSVCATKSAYIPPHLRKKTVDGKVAGTLKAKGKSLEAGKPLRNEKDKKIFNLQKKIDDTLKLKEKADSGETLQPNQLLKIEKLGEFYTELEKLKMEA
uniref:Eukaryotic translation initiation factor 2A n=1 Tax=Parastrongyloides trichosuri TaxID=131310 RepID=A0A0N4ZWX7_PARTI